MATLESMAIRSDAACSRIEAMLKALGVEINPLPRLMHDREMLRAVQLEKIADALEQVATPATASRRSPVKPVKAKGKGVTHGTQRR
jgi:hypothetical protein